MVGGGGALGRGAGDAGLAQMLRQGLQLVALAETAGKRRGHGGQGPVGLVRVRCKRGAGEGLLAGGRGPLHVIIASVSRAQLLNREDLLEVVRPGSIHFPSILDF